MKEKKYEIKLHMSFENKKSKIIENIEPNSITFVEFVKYLLKYGANIHANNDEALRMSCLCENYKTVKFFVCF